MFAGEQKHFEAIVGGHGTAEQVIFARSLELIQHVFVCSCIESNSKFSHLSQRYTSRVDEAEEYAKHVRFDVFNDDAVSQIFLNRMLKHCLKHFASKRQNGLLGWIHVHVKQM